MRAPVWACLSGQSVTTPTAPPQTCGCTGPTAGTCTTGENKPWPSTGSPRATSSQWCWTWMPRLWPSEKMERFVYFDSLFIIFIRIYRYFVRKVTIYIIMSNCFTCLLCKCTCKDLSCAFSRECRYFLVL